MENAPAIETQARPAKRPRAWWQWLIGGLLLTIAGLSVGVRLWVHFQPAVFVPFESIQSTPLKVPEGMKEADHVPAADGSLAGSNVLIVTLDTTRSDRLGCYGNDKIETDTLDGLARGGILFSKAVSPASTTLPSHSAIMTGLHPYHHGARANGVFRLPEEKTTLAEILSKQGYRTGAVISAWVLDSRFGLAQGFDFYDCELVPPGTETDDDRDPERVAEKSTDVALDWLEDNAGGESPFFLWLHYFDVHQPYEAPTEYARRYKHQPYDAELAYVDDQLKRVIDYLDTQGLRDHTLIVVMGDHGQGLGQHNELTHGLLVYDTTLTVPLIVNMPQKLPRGLHVPQPVTSPDITPTILALLGLDPLERADGIALNHGPIPPDRPIFSETLEGFVQHAFSPLLTVRKGAMKYIYGPDPELYNLKADPDEQTNLIAEKPDEAKELDRIMRDFYEQDLQAAAMAQPTEQLSEEDVQQLRALGYVGEGIGAQMDEGPLPDPKSMIEEVRTAEYYFGQRHRDLDAAIKGLEQLADAQPDFYTAHLWLSRCYVQARRFADAKLASERCIEMHPNIVSTLAQLAMCEMRLGEFDKAAEHFGEALRQHPDNFTALVGLGRVLIQLQRPKEAIHKWRKALQVRPTDVEVVEMLAELSKRIGEVEPTLKLLQYRLDKDPENIYVRNAICGLMMYQGRCKEVLPIMREAVKLHPDKPNLRNNLAMALFNCGSEEGLPPLEAVTTIEQLCRDTDFQDPDYLRTLSLIYGAMGRVDEAIGIAEKARQFALDRNNTALAKVLEEHVKQFRAAKEKGVTPFTARGSGAGATTRPAPETDIN